MTKLGQKEKESPKLPATWPHWVVLVGMVGAVVALFVLVYVFGEKLDEAGVHLRHARALVQQMPDVIRTPKQCSCGDGLCRCCSCQEVRR